MEKGGAINIGENGEQMKGLVVGRKEGRKKVSGEGGEDMGAA